jgi:tetratricopeptide (TPR) repeat protein
MLTYIVNSLFKNGKLDASLQYGEKLRVAMREYDGLLYDKYLFFYYSSQVINYSVKDLDKAIGILNVAKDDPVIRKVPMHVAFIYLNLSVTYFDKGDFKTSLRNLVKLTMDDSFKKLDHSFRLKVAVAELMIRYELGDVDYIEHRSKQVMKEFAELHRSKEHERDFDMVKLIVMMTGNSNVARDKKINDAAGDFVRKYGTTSNDIISYNNWLRSKCAKIKL